MGLAILLNSNVAELMIRRRHPKQGHAIYRRMLCTNDQRLLQSGPGVHILNYKKPSGKGLNYNPNMKMLICVWDIFMQSYRMVNCRDCDVVSVIKTSPDPKKFWTYFTDKLLTMSAGEKMIFMNN